MDIPAAQQFVRTIIETLGCSIDTMDMNEVAGTQVIAVATPDSQMLIGRGGETLKSLNYLLRRAVEKSGADMRVMVDINGYQAKELDALRTKVMIIADRARSFNRAIELEPMSSYERMLVHSFLQDVEDIVTESTGEGKERRVVVKISESVE